MFPRKAENGFTSLTFVSSGEGRRNRAAEMSMIPVLGGFAAASLNTVLLAKLPKA
jgi:hypothetical protein